MTDLFTRPQRWAHNTVWVHHRCPISQPQWPLGLDIFYARAGTEKSVTPLGWQAEWMWRQLPVMSPLKRGEEGCQGATRLSPSFPDGSSAFMQPIFRFYESPSIPFCKSLCLDLFEMTFCYFQWKEPHLILCGLPGLASLWHLPLLFFFFGMFSPEPPWLFPSLPSSWIKRPPSQWGLPGYSLWTMLTLYHTLLVNTDYIMLYWMTFWLSLFNQNVGRDKWLFHPLYKPGA